MKIKLSVKGYWYPVELRYEGKRVWLTFKFYRPLVEEIKTMEGAKWHGFEEPPIKAWSITNSLRNDFRLRYLQGEKVYAPWDKQIDISICQSKRDLWHVQREMVASALSRPSNLWGCEMGTGKSLGFIEVMEQGGFHDDEVWYVGPRSGVRAVSRDLNKWDAKIRPCQMLTYEKLTKKMETFDPELEPIPRLVFFDESTKAKTPAAKRSQASKHLADMVREYHGTRAKIILATGSPAPKSPADWWHQCEIAAPGYLREGNIQKFKARLCLIREEETATGKFPKIVTWYDDESKCKKCGEKKDHLNHFTDVAITGGPGMQGCTFHPFEGSKNEVADLYRRMKGLTLVRFKKDCDLDLPDKIFEIIKVRPTPEILNAAKLIAKVSARAVQTLTLLRELSDGFQYENIESGEVEECELCKGNKQISLQVPKPGIDVTKDENIKPENFTLELQDCPSCDGVGTVPIFKRNIVETTTPKDKIFIDDLDECEEIGRYVVWGGFEGTLDRLCRMAKSLGWAVLRVDGKGYRAWNALGETQDVDVFLDAMDGSHPRKAELLERFPRICFVGNAKAGGMALNLTASPINMFFSNSFDGEARIQAIERGHRAGMDKNKGLTIKDLVMLPTDQLVLDNLNLKKKLQDISMGEVSRCLDS